MVEYIEKEAAQKIICGWCGVCKSPTVCDLMHCDDICPQFAQIPAADVRPKWKSVREFTPEPGRYLTCCKSMVLGTDYYLRILSYTDNLESVDEYDFEGERIPGWFEYDSEYGHYSCDNVEWFMPLPKPPKEE